MEGAAGGLPPPRRNCWCRRASPATAPLAWKSREGAQRPFSYPLFSRQALGGYTRPEPSSEGGSLPPPWCPLQGRGEPLWRAQPCGAHLVSLEEPGFGEDRFSPRVCFIKGCLLVFQGSSSLLFKWEGFRGPQMRMTKVLVCLPCSSSSTWFSAPAAADRSQLETEPRGLGSITRQVNTHSELISLSRQASLLKDINPCFLGATTCLRHFRNSSPSLLVRI